MLVPRFEPRPLWLPALEAFDATEVEVDLNSSESTTLLELLLSGGVKQDANNPATDMAAATTGFRLPEEEEEVVD